MDVLVVIKYLFISLRVFFRYFLRVGDYGAIEQIVIEAIDIIKAQVAVQQWKLDELKEKNENLA